jgi:ribosomal protein S19
MRGSNCLLKGRSLWKGPFFVQFPTNTTSNATIKTMARASTILPSHVGKKFGVHNGKHFIDVFVTEDMVITDMLDCNLLIFL